MPTTIEKPRSAGPGSGLGGDWRVIVRNDDHNTFEHVARTLARVIPGVNLDQGHRIADQIHNSGQAIVWSGPREPAEHFWAQLDGGGPDDGPAGAGMRTAGAGRLLGALIALICLVAALDAASAGAAQVPSGFRDEVAFAGLSEPTTFRFAPDGRVFVAEKTGRILVFDSLSDPTPTLFANLAKQVQDAYDRGLLGLALDPGFPARPYVYALYTYDHQPGHERRRTGLGRTSRLRRRLRAAPGTRRSTPAR